MLSETEKKMLTVMSNGNDIIIDLLRSGVRFTPELNKKLDEHHKLFQAALDSVLEK